MDVVAPSTDTRKRSLEDNDNDKTPYQLREPPSLAKRRVTNATSGISDNMKPSRFLPFHFKMLRSLYDLSLGENNNDDNTISQHVDKNEPDDAIWQAMETFLKERPKVLQTQKEAKESQGVHLAAMSYLGKSTSSSTSSVSSRPVLGDSPDPIFRRASHEQTTNSPSIYQSPLNKSLHKSFASLASQTTGPRKAFRLAALLVQKRAATVQAQYHAASKPYGMLHAFVKEQMAALTDECEQLQEALGQSTRSWRQQLVESPRSPSSASHVELTQERRSELAAQQAKLQLWKLFYQDLSETMRGDKNE